MADRRGREYRNRSAGWIAVAILFCAGGLGHGQDVVNADLPPEYMAGAAEITLTGCCGAASNSFDYPPAYGVDSAIYSGCGAGGCVGRPPCCDHHAKTHIGRFCSCIYECICCPDPCYEPRWQPIADAAFFVDAVRPVTQQRFRLDAGLNVILPDRANYFWSPPTLLGGLGPPLPETRLRYYDLTLYTEAASKLASIWVETPYRSLEAQQNGHFAGFSDIKVGTKTLLFDCELIQIGMQMTTHIPVGVPLKGLGNGVFAIEPSLLVGLKLGPETYLQTQVSEWIPFTGIPSYQGAMLIYGLSLNQVIWRPIPNVPIIATLEFNGFSFQDGGYSTLIDPATLNDPNFNPANFIPESAGGYTYLYLGAGLRMVICDRVDFGIGARGSLRSEHWADPLIRSEFRLRF